MNDNLAREMLTLTRFEPVAFGREKIFKTLIPLGGSTPLYHILLSNIGNPCEDNEQQFCQLPIGNSLGPDIALLDDTLSD